MVYIQSAVLSLSSHIGITRSHSWQRSGGDQSEETTLGFPGPSISTNRKPRVYYSLRMHYFVYLYHQEILAQKELITQDEDERVRKNDLNPLRNCYGFLKLLCFCEYPGQSWRWCISNNKHINNNTRNRSKLHTWKHARSLVWSQDLFRVELFLFFLTQSKLRGYIDL